MNKVYLDNASSTIVLDEVKKTFNQVIDNYYANSQAKHSLGNLSQNLFKEARKQVASLCVVEENEVIFTSGATESINLALKGYCFRNMHRKKHLVTTTIEHLAVANTIKYLVDRFGFEVTYVKPVNGQILIEDVLAALRPDTLLVSIIHVQSELGIISPIEALAKQLANRDVVLHVDACQSFGKVALNLQDIDMVSISFHKLHGIKGSGLLIKKNHVLLDSLIHGSLQQSLRSGTIPLELCVCGAKTLRIAMEGLVKNQHQTVQLWNYLYNNLVDQDIMINSLPNNSPYIFNFSIKDINVAMLVREMSNKGFYIASKTACANDANYSNAVYELSGDMDLAINSIRVSLSKFTTKSDIKRFVEELLATIKRVRSNQCG